MSNNEYKTWSELKKQLDYPSEVEKEVISQMAKLVNEIVRYRKSQGLTQRDVAERAGITQAQVARLETSATVPSMETVIKVATSLGLRISLVESNNQLAAAGTA